MDSYGDWELDIYKCQETAEMSRAKFETLCRYSDTNREAIYPQISLDDIMRLLSVWLVNVKTGTTDLPKSGTFDNLPKSFVKCKIIRNDGNFKTLLCESEGFFYYFDYCTS